MKQVILMGVVMLASVLMFSESQAQKFDLKASIERGKSIYTTQCITCHLEQGEGIATVYPPLAKSDYLMADKVRSIKQVLNGVTGTITVNGVAYDGVMTGFDMTDTEVSDVLNYIRNSFGNKGAAVTPADVKTAR
jgi:nitrite reductase (NO-forming)